VAKLETNLTGGRWHVVVTGRLGAADLRRLERACAPALAQRPPPLDMQLDAVTDVDKSARMFMRRLLESGAALIGASAAAWREWLQRDRDHQDANGPAGGSEVSSSSRGAS
jgi:hypothetical protein